MIRRFLARQSIALLALAFAVGGGGAYAAATLPKNSVKAYQIAPNAVGASELAPNAVAGGDVRDGSLGSRDLAPAARRLPPAKVLSTKSYAGVNCTDDDENGEACATLPVKLGVRSSLSIQARANWGTAYFDDTTGPSSGSDGTQSTAGFCAIRLDGDAIAATVVPVGETRATGGAGSVLRDSFGGFTGTLTTTGTVAVVGAGNHAVDLFCTEVDGDIDWSQGALSVTTIPLG